MRTYEIVGKNQFLKYKENVFDIQEILFNIRSHFENSIIEIFPLVYVRKYTKNFFCKIIKKYNYTLDIYDNVDDITFPYACINTMCSKRYSNGFQKVEVKDIPYLNIELSRCILKDLMFKKDLYNNNCYNIYSPFSLMELMELSTFYDDIYDNICLYNCGKCKELTAKIKRHEYDFIEMVANKYDDENIVLYSQNGRIILGEGKHRCCAFKRCHYDSIFANVIVNNDEKNSEDIIIEYDYKNLKKNIKEFYTFFKNKFNLNVDDIKKLYDCSTKTTFFLNMKKLFNINIVKILLNE